MQFRYFACICILFAGCVVQAKEAQRIIALAPHIVENLFAIGAGERIVGTVEYADYPQEASDIVRIGGHNGIALERVLALQPDLVIAWQSGNKKADLDKLEKLGIKVIYSNTKDITKVADELRLFGRLTGQNQQAKRLAEQFTARLQALKTQYKNSASLRVFYQLWPEPMMTINNNTVVHQLLDVCAVENAFADNATDYPQISIENVLQTNPQVIVLPVEKSKKVMPTIDWQAWPEIPAVKHKQFIEVDADLLHRFSTRVLDGVTDMCDKLQRARTHYQQQ
ncbi:Vitamin B12-binding protein [Pseudoalteromonas sp. CIP111854]|uniref:Vitamin B12-binding protein n=1 Tax=Pseudoalteromonas holothuriae TaxID=2963714 RepID=A0A9W4QRC1_9GAMM|nr:cobalamin-binding protein [Pseudoalteromonas sp. CIP111854]CAH9049844.1 Vitamin B12-binding protein [Pseudoalteromonas sp. CIP111854]